MSCDTPQALNEVRCADHFLDDEDVRADMSDALDRIAPEEGPKGQALYRHEYVSNDELFTTFKANSDQC